jgi:hypothetical protein
MLELLAHPYRRSDIDNLNKIYVGVVSGGRIALLAADSIAGSVSKVAVIALLDFRLREC